MGGQVKPVVCWIFIKRQGKVVLQPIKCEKVVKDKGDELHFEYYHFPCFAGGSDSKVSACNVGDLGSIPVLGWSSGGENGNPLQYSCLENPMDWGAWGAAVHGVAKSRIWLSDFTFTFTFLHWRRKWQPTPVFLPGESQGRGSLAGCRLWGHTESDTTEVT